MKKSSIVSGVAALILVAASLGVAQAQKESAKSKKVVYVSSEHATFKAMPGTDVS